MLNCADIPNNIARGVLPDELYDGAFHLQVSFFTRYARKYNLIYAHEKSMACPAPSFTKRHDLQIPCTDFCPNRTKDAENTDKILFTPLSKVWVPLHRPPQLSSNAWGSVVPDYIQIG